MWLRRVPRWSDFGFDDYERSASAFDELRREMERVFEGVDRRFQGAAESYGPRVTMHDGGDSLVLRADLPGVEEKDLDVSIEQNALTLRGRRKSDAPEGYGVHRKERAPYEFARTFTLPFRVDAEHVTAELTDGVLHLTLPKAPDEKPRRIAVRAG